MRILVTGGCGFIGSHLVRSLIRTGDQVLNFDRLTYAGNLDSISDFRDHPNHELVIGDICDAAAVKQVMSQFEPECVVHLAAETHVDRSIDSPKPFIETNVVGTFQLLQSSLQYWQDLPKSQKGRFRFLHVSTDEVYGSCHDGECFRETSNYAPRSPYSASKASSDHLVRAWYHTFGLPTIVTHSTNNYGSFQFPEKLVPVVILKCLRREPIPVYGSGMHVRDWLHVEDHCDGIRTVMERGVVGETYNIGANDEKSNLELVHLLCKCMDEILPREDGRTYATQIELVEDRPGHDMRYATNTSKINSELGWNPTRSGEEGFRTTVQWYLEHRTWWGRIVDGTYQLERLGLLARAQESLQ